jgi:hypothetical protein
MKEQSKLAKKYIPIDKPFAQRDYEGYTRELRKIKKNIRRQGADNVQVEDEGLLDK